MTRRTAKGLIYTSTTIQPAVFDTLRAERVSVGAAAGLYLNMRDKLGDNNAATNELQDRIKKQAVRLEEAMREIERLKGGTDGKDTRTEN